MVLILLGVRDSLKDIDRELKEFELKYASCVSFNIQYSVLSANLKLTVCIESNDHTHIFRAKELSKEVQRRRAELAKSKTAENIPEKRQLDDVAKKIAKLEVCSRGLA